MVKGFKSVSYYSHEVNSYLLKFKKISFENLLLLSFVNLSPSSLFSEIKKLVPPKAATLFA